MKLYLLQYKTPSESRDEMPRRAIICGIFSNSRLATLNLLKIATLDRAKEYENNLDGLEKDLLQGGICLGHASFLPVTSENYLKEWAIVVKDIDTLVENASLVQEKPKYTTLYYEENEAELDG